MVNFTAATGKLETRKLVLYHFPHCPYCIRVRLALGYLNLEYESVVVQYDDQQTPERLTGVKMLPILTLSSGESVNESLDIIKLLPGSDQLVSDDDLISKAQQFVSRLGDALHPLVIPYWLMLPEFSPGAKKYFLNKQAKKRGDFLSILSQRQAYESETQSTLAVLKGKLQPYFHSETFTLADVVLAAHLWSLRLMPEFEVPEFIDHYLRSVASVCRFRYFDDIWRSPDCLRIITGNNVN